MRAEGKTWPKDLHKSNIHLYPPTPKMVQSIDCLFAASTLELHSRYRSKSDVMQDKPAFYKVTQLAPFI